MGDKIRVLIGTIPLQLIFGLIYVWGSISPFVQSQSDWTPLQINLVFALTPLATVPAVLIGGRLADMFPLRNVLIGAMSLFTLGGVLAFSFSQPAIFIAGYSVIGLGFGAGLSTPGSLAAITRTFPRAPGTMAGLLMAIYGMSAMVVAPVFTLLINYFNWIDSLRIICLSLAVLGWIGVLILPHLPPQKLQASRKIGKKAQVLKHHPLMLNVAVLVISAPIGSLIFAEIGNIASSLTISPFLISLSVVSMSVGNGIGRFLGGFIADRIGVITTRNIVIGTTLASSISFLAFSHLLSGLMILAIFLGLGFGGLSGMLSPLAQRIIPESPHFGFGFLFGGFALGSFIGPVLSSYIEITIIIPILSVLTLILMGITRKQESKQLVTDRTEVKKYGS